MERIYAFTDEYGQFGWDINKQDVSSCFIISAIIVKESDLGDYSKQIEFIEYDHIHREENCRKRREDKIDCQSQPPYLYLQWS